MASGSVRPDRRQTSSSRSGSSSSARSSRSPSSCSCCASPPANWVRALRSAASTPAPWPTSVSATSAGSGARSAARRTLSASSGRSSWRLRCTCSFSRVRSVRWWCFYRRRRYAAVQYRSVCSCLSCTAWRRSVLGQVCPLLSESWLTWLLPLSRWSLSWSDLCCMWPLPPEQSSTHVSPNVSYFLISFKWK